MGDVHLFLGSNSIPEHDCEVNSSHLSMGTRGAKQVTLLFAKSDGMDTILIGLC